PAAKARPKFRARGPTPTTGAPPPPRGHSRPFPPQSPPYIVISHGAFVFGTFNTAGIEETIGTGADFRGGNPAVIKPLASFLRAHQLGGGYTPGPLFAFAPVAGLARTLTAPRPPPPPPPHA